ncbi:MAG: hypothetical protein JNL11_14330 [Bdellovibrionaceae bacterium]|nr:hypothetical protein [Pseudobdellovibrionaceae bacterium]
MSAKPFSHWSSLFLTLFFCFQLAAKTPAYRNDEDAALKVKTVFFEPFSDNVNQIYATKAETKIRALVESDNQWDITANKKEADLVIESRLTKNPKSYTLKMNLLFKSQVVLQDSKEIDNIFETEKILGHYESLFLNLKARIPYQGIILSRTQDQVTINLGTAHGVTPNQEVLAIHIVKLNLHPKTRAYISSEKVIIGKILLTKVDEFLSFGTISFEREPQLLKKETKLEYSRIDKPSLADRSLVPIGNQISPTPQGEWIPRKPPQYGKFGISGGLIQYTQNLNFQTAGNKTVSQWLTPTIKGLAELWLNPEFHLELFIRQSTFKIGNPIEGSEPGSLNMSLSQYQIKAKYNYELDSSARSPQFQAALGIGSFQALADKSTPLSLASQSYGGVLIGFKGIFAVSEESPIDLGLYFNYFLSKTLKDTSDATPSGVQISDFGMILRYLKSQNLAYTFELSFESYSADFDMLTGIRPDPSNSVSNKLTTTLIGLEYSF